MVKIKKARPVGFCFGVKRAINIAEDTLKTRTRVYSLGPVIHNPLVVKDLSDKGIKIISNVKQVLGGKILIRSHGIQPSIRRKIREERIGIIDATCPFVERSHRIVDNLRKKGFYIIIVGEKSHPEVKALSEAAGKNKKIVISSKQIQGLNLKNKRIGLLVQSTLTKSLFKKITSSVLDREPFEVRIFDTICRDVAKRQSEAVRLSRLVDLILVIGGKMSANTKRLTQLARAEGVKTYHLEAENQIKRQWFKNVKSVGVVSGSSTPDWIVDKVIARIKEVT